MSAETPYVAPQGYANPGLRERREAELAAEAREEKAALLADAAADRSLTVSELTAGIIEEAETTMPFADSTGPTGVEVAEANDSQGAVMDMAIGASSAAHLARAAAREPELPSHGVLVQAAVKEILSPSHVSDEPWTVEDDEPEDAYEADAQEEADEVDTWLASVDEMENEEQEDEWGEVA
jgi:hypothetical protein